MNRYTYKDYSLEQSSYNNHYMIFNKTGNMVFHCSCTKELTDEEKEKAIQNYLELRETIENKILALEVSNEYVVK
ncbi:MAG TPA: hypothetical protein GX708_13130 [Gallicola sp.]|nr:hypothetical protein [Gallicola sp.]